VLGLTKAMARELAPDNVRVNAICPGFIATDITAGKLTPDMNKTMLDGIPMGRAGEAKDVAGCASSSRRPRRLLHRHRGRRERRIALIH
jgi:NAD(P)-dependent dehydrogenase (short-subunit alcohol dehydrogenase family)